MYLNGAVPTEKPSVYVRFFDEGLDPHGSLLCLDKNEVVELIRDGTLDGDSPLVRYMIHQMDDYDCTYERIFAVVFDSRKVISNVFRMPP